MCAFVWLPEEINVFSEIKVFKCFLCACAANDAGRKATSGSPQELGAKWLVHHKTLSFFNVQRGGWNCCVIPDRSTVRFQVVNQ